jgi:hypothetical protein
MIGFNGGLIGKTRTYTTVGANSGVWTLNERTIVVRVPPVVATGGTESRYSRRALQGTYLYNGNG